MVLKFKSKLNSKFILNGSKTIKIMKGSKNRGGLTQVKVTHFLHIKKQEISICYDNKKIHAKKCVTGWAVRSEHHIDILNAQSIGKEHLRSSSQSHLSKNFFLGFNEEAQKEPPKAGAQSEIFQVRGGFGELAQPA